MPECKTLSNRSKSRLVENCGWRLVVTNDIKIRYRYRTMGT
jgi:hypothetical protein